MATYPEHKPFPLTPYPFHQPNADESTSLASISEWLELPEENEAHHPESNALTPEEWIACDGQEDTTWVVGEPDWLDEGTKGVEQVSDMLLRPGPTTSSDGSMISPSDGSSSEDTNAGFDQPQEQIAEHPLLPDVSDEPIPLGSNLLRGVIRRRNSEDEVELPERKRPRLERLIINHTQQLIASPRVLTSPQIQYNPTPVSPNRQFHRILAEKPSKDGVMFKVAWRESWVHESKMPDIEPIRRAQHAQFGEAWDILPGILSPQY